MNRNFLRSMCLLAVILTFSLASSIYALAQSKSDSHIIRKKLNPRQEITVEDLLPQSMHAKSNNPPQYDPKGKIDPFKPLINGKSGVKTGSLRPVIDRQGQLTDLEKVDLSQLRLTGVVHAQSASRGLVQESAGKGHIVQIGTFIGARGGQVVSILNDRVIIEEQMKDERGKIIIKTSELKLAKKNDI